MNNSWPGGHRHAMEQGVHEVWNAYHYPGTRQLCVSCNELTGRCEDDSLYTDDDRAHGPLCEECWHAQKANQHYPDGCKCTDGSCDWCLVYYNGLPETYLVRATRLMIDAI